MKKYNTKDINDKVLEFAISHKRDKVDYLGVFMEKRTYALTWNIPPKTYGGLPLLVQVSNDENLEISFVEPKYVVGILIAYSEKADLC